MSDITCRKATKNDLPEIVRLLAEDPQAGSRETYRLPLPECYLVAFAEIDGDPNQLLLVAEQNGAIVGTLQLTRIPNISFRGVSRALIEAVMVDKHVRGQGIGSQMLAFAIEEARKRGCRFVQLTSNKNRKDAHRFYGHLGFVASHEGFKCDLGEKQQ